MPLGVIQPRDGKAPGTVILIDDRSRRAAFNFKHAAGKVHHEEEIVFGSMLISDAEIGRDFGASALE